MQCRSQEPCIGSTCFTKSASGSLQLAETGRTIKQRSKSKTLLSAAETEAANQVERNSQHFPTYYLKTHTTLQRTDVGQVIVRPLLHRPFSSKTCALGLLGWLQVVAFGIAALSSFFNGSFPACQRLPTGPPLDPVLFNGLVCVGVFLSSLLVPFLFNQAGSGPGGLKLRKSPFKTVHQLFPPKRFQKRQISAIVHDLVQSPEPERSLYSTDVR